MQRLLSLFLFLFAFQASANITWSSVATLFSSGSESGSSPQLAVHPTAQTASLLWIGTGSSSTTIYSSDFSSGSWSSPNEVSVSSETQSSLQLCIDSSGIKTAIWDEVFDSDLWVVSSQNRGLGWNTPSFLFPVGVADASLHLSLSAPGVDRALITWQDSDSRTHGASYLSGILNSSYYVSQEGLVIANSFLNSNTVPLYTSGSMLYYQTIDPLSPPDNPINTQLFPRKVGSPLACALDPSVNRAAFAFQDTKSLFLINAMVDRGGSPTYTTIALPLQAAVSCQMVISPIDHLPVAVWQVNSGEVRVARFDGHGWVGRSRLTSNGSLPQIAINPTNNHFVAIWVDGNTQTLRVSEFNQMSWSTATSLSSTGTAITNPQIKINSKGYAFISWCRQVSSGSNGLIEAVYGQ